MSEPRIEPHWTVTEAIANYGAFEQYNRALKVWEAGIRDWKQSPAYQTNRAQILGRALKAELKAITR